MAYFHYKATYILDYYDFKNSIALSLSEKELSLLFKKFEKISKEDCAIDFNNKQVFLSQNEKEIFFIYLVRLIRIDEWWMNLHEKNFTKFKIKINDLWFDISLDNENYGFIYMTDLGFSSNTSNSLRLISARFLLIERKKYYSDEMYIFLKKILKEYEKN